MLFRSNDTATTEIYTLSLHDALPIYVISQAEGTFDTTGVFAGMTVLAIVVVIVSAGVSRLERWLLRWKA